MTGAATRSIAYFGIASLLALFVIRRFHEPTALPVLSLALAARLREPRRPQPRAAAA